MQCCLARVTWYIHQTGMLALGHKVCAAFPKILRGKQQSVSSSCMAHLSAQARSYGTTRSLRLPQASKPDLYLGIRWVAFIRKAFLGKDGKVEAERSDLDGETVSCMIFCLLFPEELPRWGRTVAHLLKQTVWADLRKALGLNAMACYSLCSSDHSTAYIIKVEVCGFLNPISSLAVAFFVALINHFALWSQLDHPHHEDNTSTPISRCG